MSIKQYKEKNIKDAIRGVLLLKPEQRSSAFLLLCKVHGVEVIRTAMPNNDTLWRAFDNALDEIIIHWGKVPNSSLYRK